MHKLKKKFSLVELLVVVTIIAILFSLFVPAITSTVYSTRNAACVNNFKSMGLGFLQYCDDNMDQYPQLGAARAGIYELGVTGHRDTQGPMKPYNDGLGMKAPNGNFMCPQAVADLHPATNPNNMTYYGFFFQNMGALGSRGGAPNGGWRVLPCLAGVNGCPDSVCMAPVVGGWRSGQNVAADLGLMMRKLGDMWQFKTAMTGRYNRGGVKDLFYNIVATDFSIVGDGLETNHVWNADKNSVKQNNGNSLNRSRTEDSIINLLLDNGSVLSRKLWYRQIFIGGEDGWNFRSSMGAGREQWAVPLNLGLVEP